MHGLIKFVKNQSAPRLIAIGFFALILLGCFLLKLPFCIKEGAHLSFVDSLFTSTSAVCVTGLVTVDIANTFTPIGQTIVAILIQLGGLGVTTVGAGIILALGKKVDVDGMRLIKEGSNLLSSSGTTGFIKDVFFTTVLIELAGAVLCFFTFIKDYPLKKALGISLFHSVATFNNSGFDIFGNFRSLESYRDNYFLNIITALLIFLGGIGFLVIKELLYKKFNFKKLSMHSKIVLSVSVVLIVLGTLIVKLTENISWLGAFFTSVSTRTAGFATYNMGAFKPATLLVIIVLMFIGASPGSTGGGIKTSTFFALLIGIKSAATNKSESAFHYAFPKAAFKKACVIALIAVSVILMSTYLLLLTEPGIEFLDALFEMVSAFGTVGLSTGVTPSLSTFGKAITIIVMYIGRLGPLTVASVWYFSRGERVKYAEGNIAIG